MATTTGNKLNWSDIQSIYTSLNNCQTKFGLSKTSIPSNPGVAKPSVVTNLKSAIFSLQSSKYVNSSFVSSVFNLSVPTVGSLIKPAPFDTMESALSTVYGLCANNSNFGNFGDNGNFGDFGQQGYSCFADAGCSSDFYCNAQF